MSNSCLIFVVFQVLAKLSSFRRYFQFKTTCIYRFFVFDSDWKIVATSTGERLRTGLSKLWRVAGGRRRQSTAAAAHLLLGRRLPLGRPARRHADVRCRLQLDGD